MPLALPTLGAPTPKARPTPRDGKRFQDLAEFYPYYLCEHTQPATKILHFIGTSVEETCQIKISSTEYKQVCDTKFKILLKILCLR